jgi:hypothetical protein
MRFPLRVGNDVGCEDVGGRFTTHGDRRPELSNTGDLLLFKLV